MFISVLSKFRINSRWNKISIHASLFTYSKALVRDIDPSLISFALRKSTNHSPIVYNLALKQHQEYIEVLKSLNLDVHILPSDGCPDSVFIEDTVLSFDNKIILTNLSAESRRKETKLVTDYIFKHFSSNYEIMQLKTGYIDGGDVLFTGDEIFIGLTKRTNIEGINELKSFNLNYPIHSIDFNELIDPNNNKPLHLKSICSLLSPANIMLGGEFGPQVQKLIEQKAKSKYEFHQTHDEGAANCVYVNNTILRRCNWEYPKSNFDFISKDIKQFQLANTELSKVDGALSCCSVLIQ